MSGFDNGKPYDLGSNHMGIAQHPALVVSGPHKGWRVNVPYDAEYWDIDKVEGETFTRVTYKVFPVLRPGQYNPVARVLAEPGTSPSDAVLLWKRMVRGDHG